MSSAPLTAAQAAKLLAREPVPSSQVAPSPRKPAAGAPVTPSADRHPKKDPEEDTSHPPAEAEESPRLDEARALVDALPLLSPALRHIPLGMHTELARLAARWLDACHTLTDVQEHILRGLPGAGTPVPRPGGLVRYLLRHVPARSLPAHSAPVNRLSSRLEGARECAGDHTQTTLFRPVGDETHCAQCV
ncbi:hypothetical protein [Streptomyces sp. NPDC056549]|uniref:hypothetical protein n=1 Tax=Streptomyces sp. NPDC056549 TaxID=3345864 RepID=UPI0036BC7C1B